MIDVEIAKRAFRALSDAGYQRDMPGTAAHHYRVINYMDHMSIDFTYAQCVPKKARQALKQEKITFNECASPTRLKIPVDQVGEYYKNCDYFSNAN